MSKKTAGKAADVAAGIKLVTDNRKARHDWFLEELYEAGMMLLGTEVKSLRNGKAQLTDSYAIFKQGELYLLNSHIAPYDMGNRANHEPLRTRKLLLKREELNRLSGRVEGTGYSLIPTKIYFKNGIAKVELALAKGKKAHDKRQSIKERESKRQLQQVTKLRHR